MSIYWRRCINGIELRYMLKYMLNYIVRAREVIAMIYAYVDADYDIKESMTDIQQTMQ